jgi:hypothetical protein
MSRLTKIYILTPVSVTVHVIRVSPETGNVFPLFRHPAHANIQKRCVTLTFDLRTLTSGHVSSGPGIFQLTVRRYECIWRPLVAVWRPRRPARVRYTVKSAVG